MSGFLYMMMLKQGKFYSNGMNVNYNEVLINSIYFLYSFEIFKVF